MIVMRMLGGLGNQMFQYAFGRALASHHGVPLCLDVSAYDAHQMHNGFELSRVFCIDARILDQRGLQDVYGWMARPNIWRWVRWIGPRLFPFARFLSQDTTRPVLPYKALCPARCYLEGYWQCEDLFADYDAEIRREFVFREDLSVENLNWAQKIQSVESVSMHVRRGDYASNAKTLATHGLCSSDYYKSALKLLTEKLGSPVVFVFSDDPEWVRANIDIPFEHYFVTNNHGSNSYCDMRLMSLCKSHIIANSSFSWWGAWLSNNQPELVIAPRRWFVDESLAQEIVPDHWVKA
ncbi:MAG: alpha-1,2-fucosyltransferase [Planctomycetales bacterium]|nr:alpha-1,2-fucosyltransferase [Planctomycetales bacterium]